MESLIDHHSSVQGLVLEGAGGGFGNKLLQDVSLYISKIKARLCSWLYAYLDDKFFTREDAGLVGKVLMEYASGIFLGWRFAQYKPTYH
ncbi:hypothetical protein CMV_021722 [Castanea mollissima]|uniref:Uncharacterized protein n=1 Tax=Castanea mollissima TaxID=60419 RepID=A0A8J4VCC2_9ROSI|nr:hypothetical protein CMV_021722 [Castanea mollissima]